MSTETHVEHEDVVEAHGSRKGYLTGFALSVVLTAIPFWLVMTGALPAAATAYLIMIFAAVQIIVHMVFFLHMSSKSEGGWTLMALIFTVVLVGIAFSGSLWVMYHLTDNMMPMTAQEMRQIP
ncbi:cytochrome o ubiquinol oxidase subunit IV [Sphingobium algorifonticola]|uniref:Cytochrome bo(3) ubiquinol oxidase subunit 4 n=1 Tax=Sphingobium algorifonticola TaxID=2008318 RepID=A0A437JCX6_9SPHN|nr:cytochrome o ubiquinol oxidase subunit IV [Sphingobium algorifonticola]RVT43741.1 cytochrome o ubiquinol oxidase subunit IV [Sphingobium algorifonticola]